MLWPPSTGNAESDCCPKPSSRRVRRDRRGIVAVAVAAMLGCGQVGAPDARVSARRKPSDATAALADSLGAASFVSPWVDATARPRLAANPRCRDGSGREGLLSDWIDRPTLLVFVFSRCDNPLKCSRSAAYGGQLQTYFSAERDLAAAVQVVFMTLEPTVDTPQQLEKYLQVRGVTPGADGEGQVVAVSSTSREFSAFLEEIDVPVSYDGKAVVMHDVAMYLFDAESRLVRRYLHILPERSAVAIDVRRLLAERKRPDVADRPATDSPSDGNAS